MANGRQQVDVSFLRRECRGSILFDLGLGGGVPPGPTFCPVCKEDLGSVAALGAHYNSIHAIRDNRLVTKASFQHS